MKWKTKIFVNCTNINLWLLLPRPLQFTKYFSKDRRIFRFILIYFNVTILTLSWTIRKTVDQGSYSECIIKFIMLWWTLGSMLELNVELSSSTAVPMIEMRKQTAWDPVNYIKLNK